MHELLSQSLAGERTPEKPRILAHYSPAIAPMERGEPRDR